MNCACLQLFDLLAIACNPVFKHHTHHNQLCLAKQFSLVSNQYSICEEKNRQKFPNLVLLVDSRNCLRVSLVCHIAPDGNSATIGDCAVFCLTKLMQTTSHHQPETQNK